MAEQDTLPQTSILYQNAEQSICLLDIPTSIAVGQRRSDILLSTSPLEAPFPIDEDHKIKPEKAKSKKAHEMFDEAQHVQYKAIIEAALTEIHNHVSGSWYAPRALLARVPNHGNDLSNMDIDDPEKELELRLREWAALNESKGYDDTFDFEKMMASLTTPPEGSVTSSETVTQKWLMSYGTARGVASGTTAAKSVTGQESSEPWTSVSHNPEDYAVSLTVFENPAGPEPAGPEYRFTVPPRSTFFLSDSTHSDNFRASFREITADFKLPRHFDLILLDPPWPNRSAKRKNAYEQTGGMPYIKKMLLKMDIDSYLEHNALVGVWITNKKSIRGHVLGPGGLFEQWNIGLVEEWIWVKTTIQGEPMFDIDSPMRKPYEVLLLGRAAPNSWTTMAPAPVIKKRVIAAVPDVHSRKPCLKELLEPYMPDKEDYTALEIFSRYLVAGWMSWGNEVLKFNWDKYWASRIDSKGS